jgi:hypothetical protein
MKNCAPPLLGWLGTMTAPTAPAVMGSGLISGRSTFRPPVP